jgi:TonB family protein
VEAQFTSRNVYTLVIPDVGLPEYSGDWVLWFAEDPSVGNQTVYISAPVPLRKYSAAEPEESNSERFAGGATLAARIDRSGRVSSVRVLRGPASEALRSRVIEELETWVFTPALRNREPVAVDVVIEFPFRRGGEVREAAH